MSVLIKGMEMPKHYCHDCKVWSLCWDSKPAYNMIKSKCPLVEIPSPHDELIDKKNLYNDMKNALNDYCNTSESIAGARTMMNCLSSAPKIIDKESES